MPRDQKALAVPQTVEELLATPTWLRLWLLSRPGDEVVGYPEAKTCMIAQFLRSTASVRARVGSGEVLWERQSLMLPEWAHQVVHSHDFEAGNNNGRITAAQGLAILDWCAP